MDLEIATVIQGAPVVNGGTIYRQCEGIAALEVDLKSKECEIALVTSGGVPGLCISATECSLHLDATADVSELTVISFPQFAGWTVWASVIGRYTLAVCLVKNDDESEALNV